MKKIIVYICIQIQLNDLIPILVIFQYGMEKINLSKNKTYTIAPEKIPVYLTVSNFFAGADKNLDGKQAYSTYAELGGHYDFLNDHQIALAAGMSFNKSCYNGYVHDFSVCNIELKYTYNLAMKSLTLPLSVAYIINPVYEKSHVNLTASFSF